MIKSKLFLLLIFTFVFQNYYSQDYKILSDNIKSFNSKPEKIVSILKKETKKQIFVTKVMPTGKLEELDITALKEYSKYDDDKISIYSDDYENNIFKSNKINLPNIGNNQVKYINSFISKGNAFLYSYIVIDKELKIYASKINLDSLILEKHYEIATFKNENFNNIKIFINQSEDSSKILATILNSELSKNETSIKEIVFDYELNKLWSKKIILNEDLEDIYINNIQILDNGNSFYLLSKTLNSKDVKDRLKNHFSYSKLYFHDYQNDLDYSKLIQNETYNLMLSKIIFNTKSNEIVIQTMTCNNKNRFSGYILKKINVENFEEISNFEKVFSESQIDNYTISKVFNTTQYLKCFYLRDLFILPNGNLCSIIENYFEISNSTYESFFRGNIILLNMSENGEIINEKILFRSEILTHYDGSYDLGLFLHKDKVKILVNDCPENMESIQKNDKTKSTNYKNSIMYLLTFESDFSNYNIQKLIPEFESKNRYSYIMYPKNFSFYGNNLFLYYSVYDRYRTIEIENVLNN